MGFFKKIKKKLKKVAKKVTKAHKKVFDKKLDHHKKAFKKTKDTVEKVHNTIAEPVNKLVDRVTGVQGFLDLDNLASGGLKYGYDVTKRRIESAQKTFNPEEPAPIEFPEYEAPVIPQSAASQGGIGQSAPRISLGSTERKRRQRGSARNSRSLRVPLGGLR